MDVHRLGVKFFAADPAPVALRDFVPVFHGWIQKQILKDHLLIDIHDYSHIYRGPGILLVAHQGNFSMDMADGRLGLAYSRKELLDGTPEEGVTAILKVANQACRLLEEDASLAGRLQFRTDEFLVIANDRLNTPNNQETFTRLKPVLSAGFERFRHGTDFTLTQVNSNSKDRFAVRILTSGSTKYEI